MKAKKLRQALQEMGEEGVVQVFRPADGAPAIVGVVGALQLDVLKDRLLHEYGIEVALEPSEFQLARWITARDRKTLDEFTSTHYSGIAEDSHGSMVYLARNQFYLQHVSETAPGIKFHDVKDVTALASPES